MTTSRKKSRKSRSSITIDAVFDVECQDWTTFVRGALWTRTDGVRVYADPDELMRAILAVRGSVWGHNAGAYDTLWLLDGARRAGLGATIILSGSRVLAARIGHTVIRDSYALVPLRLSVAAPMFGAHKANTGLACECGRGCGGYCAIRRDLPRAKMRVLEEYLAADVEATRKVVEGACAWLRAHGAEPRATIGATAWAWARDYLDLPPASRRYYDLLREAYYGGRVEVYRPRAERIWRYDIHSSYPAALVRTPVPVGEPRYVRGPEAAHALARGLPGAYRVTATCEGDIPPLPFRVSTGRLAYPRGPGVAGWYMRDEILGEGVRVDRVYSAVVYDAEERLLAPWCEMIWRLRVEDNAPSKWVKLIANSLTGKFAQRPEVRSARILADGDGPRDGEEIIGPVEGRIAARVLARHHACGHVAWAAALTASARVELLHQLRHAGEDAVYCDTDSVYATRPLTRRLGNGLGEWGCEGEGSGWVALAPKVYSYVDDAGNEAVRAKGLSRISRADLLRVASGESWRVDGPVRFLSGARRGTIWERATLERTLRPRPGWIGARVVVGDTTRPPTVAEALSLND